MRNITRRYGRTVKIFVEFIHKLYVAGQECVELIDIKGLPSGIYVYPYRFFTEELAYTPTQISSVMKKIHEEGLMEKVSFSKTPLYRINYDNKDIIDAGLSDPSFLLKDDQG